MEEASVAGESPDRSKQRESSAEPTSGSAGPVPEVRSEARDARDPRLALAGDSGTSGTSGSSDTAERRGGVDTATRVFSVRDVKTDADEDATDADATDEEDATDEGATETDPAAGAGKSGNAAKDGEGEGADEDGKPGAPDDARLRADAEDSEDGDEDPAAADAPEKGAENAGKSDGAAGESGKAEAEAEDAEADGGDEDTSESGAESESAAEDKPGAESESAAEDKPGAESESAAEDKPDAEPEPGAERASGVEPGAKAKAPVDQPTAVFKAPKPPVDQPTTMLKLGGDKKDGKKGEEKSEEKGDRKPGQRAERTGEKKSAPESDAERTSKFVALKPLDAPETRKPPSKPGRDSDAEPEQGPGKPRTQPTPASGKPQPPKGGPTGPATVVTPAAAAPGAAQAGPERTTQQPLPPKPPLDLLAELTNTPPPPETPLRTTVRRVKIWTPLVVLLLIVFAIVQAVRPLPAPGLTLTAKDSYTFAGDKVNLPWPDEGQGWMDVTGVGTMDHFGKQTPAAIGSVAKTMTSYIILRDHPLKPGQEGPKIEVDPQAEKEGGYDKTGDESTLNTVKAGDFLTEKQALSAVMIPSANNIARLLARWDAGSEEAFVKKMNATAKELGMTNSTYTDPSGLTKTTVSTAEDQVKLGNAVVRIPAMVAITGAASWTDPSGHNWPNYNSLPYWVGAIGIKTGTTTAAGGNLLFAARKKVGGQTVTVVGAILGQHKPSILDTVNQVSKTALLGAEEALTSAKILKKGDVVGYVDDKLGGRTTVVVTEDVTAVGWAGSKVKLSFAATTVPHSAKAGTRVGTLTVGDGGSGGAIRVPVALKTDLAEPGFTDKLTRIG
ncbi:D-alanyl-D-alanine carboxypeptidase [Streptomyces sp. NPDC015220]|uniref:D-alanyl-D-alanine carboxypeptidase n=1 Tax=Streptomyces sp. NPDC015220 TaxID=3364947 RepID=UPI0036FDC467